MMVVVVFGDSGHGLQSCGLMVVLHLCSMMDGTCRHCGIGCLGMMKDKVLTERGCPVFSVLISFSSNGGFYE